MSHAVRALAAALALASSAPAAAFVRSTTEPGYPGAGVCLWWGNRQVVYTVNAQKSTTPPCGNAATAKIAVDYILGAWGKPCTDFRFIDGGTSWNQAVGNDGENLIVFRRGSCDDSAIVPAQDACHAAGTCASLYNCWEHGTSGVGLDALALTWTTFRLSTGEILDADVELFGWRGSAATTEGAYFTCRPPGDPACVNYGDASCTSTDVATIALHEGGHMLGLDHVCEYDAPYDPVGACSADAVMGPGVLPGATRTMLSEDDEAGICTIYPIGAATRKCVPDEPEKKSSGCRSGEGTGAISIALAALALLGVAARRRRAAVPAIRS